MIRIFLAFGALLFFAACDTSTEAKTAQLQKDDEARVKIALLSYGEFSADETKRIAKEISSFYPVDVVLQETKALPGFAYYKPRNRYKADSLLVDLKKNLPPGCKYIVGLTAKDISTSSGEHKDWGVFGLGYMSGPSCVVSDFRLRGSARDKEHVHERLTKVVLHELGHTFGLPHCSADKTCMMQDAGGTIKSVDSEKIFLCAACKKIMQI
jgi:archaemetzincin